MKLTFLELPAFTRAILEVGNDETLRALQNELIQQPEKGDVIQGGAGLRKVRVALPGRGKRGGARAIYLLLPDIKTVVFVTLYTKAEKTDLTPEEKKTVTRLVAVIKQELKP